jgi:hypothetical protein
MSRHGTQYEVCKGKKTVDRAIPKGGNKVLKICCLLCFDFLTEILPQVDKSLTFCWKTRQK